MSSIVRAASFGLLLFLLVLSWRCLHRMRRAVRDVGRPIAFEEWPEAAKGELSWFSLKWSVGLGELGTHVERIG